MPVVHAIRHRDVATVKDEYRVYSQNRVVGWFELSEREDDLLHFGNIRRYRGVDPRKGVGLAMYTLMLDHYGEQFSSDSQFSESSLRMWNYLESMKVAQCVEPPIFIGESNENKF